MRQRTLIILGITILLLTAGVMAHAAAVKATLVELKGSVMVQQPGGAFAAAKDGMAVSEGATVKTGPDGSAILKWGDGNTMKIMPLSLTKVDALSQDEKTGATKSDFSLGQGRVVNRVGKLAKDSSFTVKTPAAIAGVRGTAFDMGINPETNQTSIAVVEGSVTLAAAGVELVVAEGFESAVTEGAAPQPPTEIPPAQLQELKSTVNDLKQVSEAAPTPTETKAAPAPASVTDTAQTAVDAVQSDTVEKQTIDSTINQQIQNLGCPGGGGCIRGTIDMGTGHGN